MVDDTLPAFSNMVQVWYSDAWWPRNETHLWLFFFFFSPISHELLQTFYSSGLKRKKVLGGGGSNSIKVCVRAGERGGRGNDDFPAFVRLEKFISGPFQAKRRKTQTRYLLLFHFFLLSLWSTQTAQTILTSSFWSINPDISRLTCIKKFITVQQHFDSISSKVKTFFPHIYIFIYICIYKQRW